MPNPDTEFFVGADHYGSLLISGITQYQDNERALISGGASVEGMELAHLRSPSTRHLSQFANLWDTRLEVDLSNVLETTRVTSLSLVSLETESTSRVRVRSGRDAWGDKTLLPNAQISQQGATGTWQDLAHGLEAATASGVTLAPGGELRVALEDLPAGVNFDDPDAAILRAKLRHTGTEIERCTVGLGVERASGGHPLALNGQDMLLPIQVRYDREHRFPHRDGHRGRG